MVNVTGTILNDTISVGVASAGVVPSTGATDGSDVIQALAGADIVFAGGGNDTVSGGSGNDALNGLNGNDTLNGDTGNDRLNGGTGNDTLNGGFDSDLISGGADNDVISGSEGIDWLGGDDGNDTISGGSETDAISGGNGSDTLNGGSGDDYLQGDLGSDVLNGSIGNDTFNFNSVSESPPFTGDTVAGVNGIGVPGGDVFRVSTIDASILFVNNQAFTFIGTAAFSASGQLRVANGLFNTTLIQGNVDDVLTADLQIQVQDGVIGPGNYTAGDFLL